MIAVDLLPSKWEHKHACDHSDLWHFLDQTTTTEIYRKIYSREKD